MEIDIDETFSRSYEVERLFDLPSSPDAKVVELGASGPILRFERPGVKRFTVVLPWSTEAKFYTWPSPDKLLAVPSMWLIDTVKPEASSRLCGFEGHSLHYISPVPPDFVLLGHCCELYCYDASGLAWESTDLFCCTDPVITIEGNRIRLLAHKHGIDRCEEPVGKWLDLATGERLA